MVLSGATGIVFAQVFPELRFKHLTTREGLSDNQVTCINEDRDGLMWFGTVNGLNRFDGYRIKIFFSRAGDTASLPGNDISQVVTDPRNNLWIATGGGLAYFNPQLQKALNFKQGFINEHSIVSLQCSHICFEKNNKVWVTAGHSLYEFDSSLHYKKLSEGLEPFQYKESSIKCYHSFTADKKNQLWAFSVNRIFLLNPENRQPVQTFTCPEEINISRMYFDSDNRCWLVTRGNGLYLFNPQNNQWKPVLTGFVGLSGDVTEWAINNRKYIVYISDNNIGLVFIDPQTFAVRLYKDEAFVSPQLQGNGVGAVYTDSKNILWIGTQHGISYVTPSSLVFDIIPIGMNEHLPDVSKQKVVFDIYKDTTGFWLSKWYLGGVYHYSVNWKFDKYFSSLYPLASRGLNLTSMSFNTRHYKDNLYMTTDSGLVEVNTRSLHAKVFQPGNSHTASTLRTIIPLNDTIWWIQSYYSGIFIYNTRKKTFVQHYQFAKDSPNTVPEKINEVFKSAAGNIYLCSYHGLYAYRSGSSDFVNYKRNYNDPVSFPGDSLFGITEDHQGRLWLGTNKGLCVFNQETKKIEKVFPENQFIGTVNAVCTDRWNNTWFTASTGSWCRLAANGRFINFNTENDLPQNSGDGVLAAMDDGKVYNGCLDAVIRFNPEWLMKYTGGSTKSVITEASVGDSTVPLYKNNRKSIEIASDIHLFTVDFSLVNYMLTTGNQYYYRLLPLSDAWQKNDNGHLLFYDIPAGNYTLQVKGCNTFDRVFSDTDSLLIKVRPFWWHTWWFRLACAVIMAAIIILLVKRRIHVIRSQASLLQQQASFKQRIAETEMQALRAQMNPHFIFNSLNSIENFMMKNDKKMASSYFNKFASLIRMILENSRNELVPLTKDVAAIQLYVELEQLRFDNKFSYQAIIDPLLINEDYSVPPLLIQPFVENAIIHGLAQSDEDNLHLLVSVILDNGYIVYTIQDNGIGRKKSLEYKKNIFHESLGMGITQQRINIYNRQQQAAGEVTITDLQDDYNTPCGTKVRVTLRAI